MVLKHINGGAEKINAVNYLSKPPPQNDECYYVVDSNAVNKQSGVSDLVPKAQIRKLGPRSSKPRSDLW